MIARRGMVLAALLTAIAPAVGRAQDPRARLRIAPAKLYPEMIRMVERNDWTKLDQAVGLLEPLIAELETNSAGGSLRGRLADHKPETALAAIQDLAILGVEHLVRRARTQPDGAVRRETVRLAFTEFLAIAVVVEAGRFRLRQEIEQTFRTCYAAAGATTSFDVESATLLAKLARARAPETAR